MRRIIRDFLEGLGSLIMCSFGDYVAGYLLHISAPLLRGAGYLLALLPAASDARGDVYSSYSSRLSTLLHTGLSERFMRSEAYGLIALVLLVNTWIGVLVYSTLVVMGGCRWLSVLPVAGIAVAAGVLSMIVMAPLATVLSVTVFRHGVDPDNVVVPLVTFIGDTVTVPSIIAAYLVLGRNEPLSLAVAAAAPLAAAAILFHGSRRLGPGERARLRRIMGENTMVIVAATVMSSVAGLLLFRGLDTLLGEAGLLAVLPAFLEDGGAIGCRFSARLSSMLHLGEASPDLVPRNTSVYAEAAVNLLHGLVVFSLLAVFGVVNGLSAPAALSVVAAGLALTAAITVFSYYAAVVSMKKGLDPDNVLAPFITSVADILGSALLLAFI